MTARRGALVLAGAGLLCAVWLSCRHVVLAVFEPEVRFSRATAPKAPDYSRAEHWAALPDRRDDADVAPRGERDRQSEARVDVFFVHPTTYYHDDGWNQPLDEEGTNELTDHAVMRGQASVFNSVARVFAPRYRQATLYAFMTTDRVDEADAALDLAYGDVSRAFEHYLSRFGGDRPVVVASHSQGSFHALRLLAEHFSGKPLRERLVVAYVVGIAIPTDVFTRVIPDIPLCRSAEQTGCLVTWNTVTEEADTSRFSGPSPIRYPEGRESNEGKTFVCVNPLTGAADEAPAGRELNLGGVRFRGDEPPVPDVGVVPARCRDGFLRIEPPADRGYGRLLGRFGHFHVADYSLFYVNLRRDAEARVAAYLDERETRRRGIREDGQ